LLALSSDSFYFLESTSLQHLDLDFEKYLNCDSNAQTNDKMTDEAIADFCLNKNNRRSRRRNG